MFSAETVTISLDPDNASPEYFSTDTNVANFSVSVEFDNPVSATFRDYSYGVKFRESGGVYQAITINSAGQLRYLEGTAGAEGEQDSFTEVHVFDYPDIATAGADTNTVQLSVIGTRGWLTVNGDDLGEFTVRSAGVESDVQFIAELENETQIGGGMSEILNIEVRSAEIASEIESLTMIKKAGEITRVGETGLTRDFLMNADFTSPYERILGKWTIGYSFTDPETDTTNWIIVNNSKQWKHFRQVGQSGQITEIAGDSFSGLLVDRGDVNNLEVLSRTGQQRFYINGTFITSLDIQSASEAVQLAVVSGFAGTDQQEGYPTVLSNYVAWSFGN